jgi:hypothetical protein
LQSASSDLTTQEANSTEMRCDGDTTSDFKFHVKLV